MDRQAKLSTCRHCTETAEQSEQRFPGPRVTWVRIDHGRVNLYALTAGSAATSVEGFAKSQRIQVQSKLQSAMEQAKEAHVPKKVSSTMLI